MAKAVNVVLQKDVAHLGKGGEVVKVAPGFARNFLIPQGFALPASAGNVKRFEHLKRVASERAAKARAESDAFAKKLATVDLTITMRAGSEGKLYGSVTTKDVEAALKAKGFVVDRRKLVLDPIRALGTYEVVAKIAPEIQSSFKVNVVAEEAPKA